MPRNIAELIWIVFSAYLLEDNENMALVHFLTLRTIIRPEMASDSSVSLFESPDQ